MAAKMAAEILDLMYISSASRYNDEWSVDSYEIKDVKIKYVKNNNNSCIFSKMAVKMAAENLNLMYLSSAFRYKNKWSVDSYEIKDVEIKYVEKITTVAYFPRWRPRWSPKILNRCISVLLAYTTTNKCVQSCYAKEIVSNYVEIHNKNCIIFKMAANMAAE